MDIIDNLIYATYASPLQIPGVRQIPTLPRIDSDYIHQFVQPVPPENVGLPLDPVFVYAGGDKMNFCSYQDPDVIENTILRHWYDIDNKANYDSGGITAAGGVIPLSESRYSSFTKSSTYHLIFAYLTENTRMLQIFERLIEKYLHDEEFGIAENPLAFNWIMNSERLFFRNDSLRSLSIRSLIRPSADASRRNAYWRMFGMDLECSDINSERGGSLSYSKAKASNQQFVPLFEKYLTEVWQSYINVRNTSGVNTTDINIVTDLATDLRELLIARRGNTAINTYANLNLSREEFSSVLITSWFYFIISDNTPVVQFLNCPASTIGERLINIGNKVGIPAHSKSQALFEMSAAASYILRTIEDGGILDDPAKMNAILFSLTPGTHNDDDMNFITNLLAVINYWEKVTGHRIKNPEIH